MSMAFNRLTLEELLHEADRSDDPLVRELMRRLDEAAYHVSAYRKVFGMPNDPAQLPLFKEL